MSPPSEFQEKIDVLDIIIGILRDHEKSLSRLVERFDDIYDAFLTLEGKILEQNQIMSYLDEPNGKNKVDITNHNGHMFVIRCKDWLTFQDKSKGASIVTFEIEDGIFSFSSVSDPYVFIYSERLPEIELRIDAQSEKVSMGNISFNTMNDLSVNGLKEGLIYNKILYLSPPEVKRWLSAELKVPEKNIIEGKIFESGDRL